MNNKPIKETNRYIRSKLIDSIVTALSEVTNNQTQASKLLGVSQPRISALMQKKVEEFRIDMLIDFAAILKLNPDVTFDV